MNGSNIPGFPEGLKSVRFGEAAEGEWILKSDGSLTRNSHGLIVELLPGWTVRFWPDEGIKPARLLAETLEILVEDESEKRAVLAFIKRLKSYRSPEANA